MNIFRKNNVLIQGLISDSFDFLQRTYNQSRQNFTVASAWGQILFVLQNISQLILYFVEDSITEMNIYQAARDSSVKSLARIAGYDPGRATSAQGEISIKWNLKESDVGGGAVIIPNNIRIRCEQNGYYYSLVMNSPMIKMNLVANSAKKFKIVQGTFKNSTFTGTGRLLQSFNVNAQAGSYVDHHYINAYVNEDKWNKYDSLYDIPFDGKGFLARQAISKGVDVFFGNENFGKIPQRGARVRVEYLETLGFDGNLRSTNDNPLSYTFADPGEDLFGNEVNLNNYLTIVSEIDPSFGTNPEPISLIRLVAPKTSRSFVFANADNYEIFLEKMNIFSQVSAFTTFDDENLADDNIIYIFLVPDVTLNMESNEDYFDLDISDFFLTKDQRTQILNLLEDSGSMIATTVVKILQPSISRYVGNALITVYEGYDIDVIKDNVREQISDYFINLKRRDRVPKSDIIAILEGIEGIDSVSFYFTCQKNEKNQRRISGLSNLTTQQRNEILGLNDYGDIIMKRDELVMLRGGFTDRNGVYYEEGIVSGRPSSLNITVTEIVSKSFSSERSNQQKAALIQRNNSR